MICVKGENTVVYSIIGDGYAIYGRFFRHSPLQRQRRTHPGKSPYQHGIRGDRTSERFCISVHAFACWPIGDCVGALFRLPPRMKDKAKELVGSFIDMLERTTQSSRRPMRAPDLQRPTRELACRKEGVTHKARSYISIAAMVLAASFTAPAMAQSLESAQSAARRLLAS